MMWQINWRGEFARYLLVGVWNTAVSLFVYWLFLLWTTHVFAYLVAFVVGIVSTTLANAYFTFGTGFVRQRFAAYAIFWTLLAAINTAFLDILVGCANIDRRWAILVVMLVGVPAGFLGARAILGRQASLTARARSGGD